ncbi:hypothetical protein HYT04_01260 [Candidatus Kaiserbacteria bacterium]|nr:hypothetical protein [Candidatus Kaiserbacteria bacterium]
MDSQLFKNLNIEWQKTIKEIAVKATQIKHGELIVKIQDGKPLLSEYRIRRKPPDTDDFVVTDIA